MTRTKIGGCCSLGLAVLLAGLMAVPARAQDTGGDPHAGASPTYSADPNFGVNPVESVNRPPAANIFVSIREVTGVPVSGDVNVQLKCPLNGVSLRRKAGDVGTQVQFMNIPAGDCAVEVTAPGYKAARESTEVLQAVTARNQYLFVYLHPTTESASANAVKPVVNAKLFAEIDKGLQAMRKQHADEASKHFEKAAQLSPGNPDVLYLLGLSQYNQRQLPEARKNFESSLTYAPTNEKTLVALGQLDLESGHPQEASVALEKALQANGASSRTHLMLASAYAKQKNYAKAEVHAERAVELGGDNVVLGQYMLGQILAAKGDREGARKEFELLIQKYPKDPEAAKAQQAIAILDKPGVEMVVSGGGLEAGGGSRDIVVPALPVVALQPWAPEDIDRVAPGVLPDVACSEAEVLERTERSIQRQYENLEKFIATEHIEHQEVNSLGGIEKIRAHDFRYLVFLEHDKHGEVFLNESRDGGTGIEDFPTGLATVGLIGLGVDIFTPGFSKALDFKCEGLGQWRGKPTWIIHFSQRTGERSYLRLWETRHKTVEIPLKGRVWVESSTYEVLHVESDLREPMGDLELKRDHLVIDYGPVKFHNGETELWLPWSADMYMELHGKRYHHRHTLLNYSLFGVDTNNKIMDPKGMPPVQDNEKPAAPKKP